MTDFVRAERDRDHDLEDDWTGVWLRRALSARGMEEKTRFTVNEIRTNRQLPAAIAEALQAYWEWEYDEEIKEGSRRMVEDKNEFPMLSVEWVAGLIDEVSSKDGRDLLELDSSVTAERVTGISRTPSEGGET